MPAKMGERPEGPRHPVLVPPGRPELAHRVARLEQEANQQTHNLEQTLSKLLSDVPDEPSAPVPLLDEDGD